MSYLFEVHYGGACIAVRVRDYEQLFKYLSKNQIEADEIRKIHRNVGFIDLTKESSDEKENS